MNKKIVAFYPTIPTYKNMFKIVLFISIMLSLSCTHSGESYRRVNEIPEDATSIMPTITIFSQRVRLSMPMGWKPIYQKNSKTYYLIEFVPSEQNLKNWNEMITVIGYKDAAKRVTPLETIAMMARRAKSVCPESFVMGKSGQTTIDGFKAFEGIFGCSFMSEDHPTGLKKGQAEITYHLAIKGKNEIYLIQKAIRMKKYKKNQSPISKDNYIKFISPLFPISLCNKTGHPYECFK